MDAKTKAAVLDVLEQLVKHGTEKRGEAVVLMFDHEDGFFLSTVETGTRHWPVKDSGDGVVRKSLAEAVVAAAEWHNSQGEKWYMEHLKRVPVPAL